MDVELTDTMIRDSFNKTGVDEKYYSIYEAEAKRCYDSLMKDCPDDDDILESSLSLTDDYIKYYVEEAEKGHCHKWCDSVARICIQEGKEDWIYRDVYDGLESDEEKNRELDIHTNSLSDDPIFRDRYKSMFEESIPNLIESTEEYTRVYHSLIEEGKSNVYAHAYAYVSNDLKPLFCEIYAEAFELATQHGMDSSEAYCFGNLCTEACDFGYWVYIDDFLKNYQKTWQKDFYIKLICDEIRREENREISSSLLNDLRKKMGLN